MSAANTLALISVAFGYIYYSKNLSPAEFGLYSASVTIAKIGATVLDGGLKMALIKKADAPSCALESAILRFNALFSAIVSICLAAFLFYLFYFKILDLSSFKLILLYSLAYFLTYPLILIPTSRLERKLKFGPIALAEGLSAVFEYALPAILWGYFSLGFWSFVIAAWVARLFRLSVLQLAEPCMNLILLRTPYDKKGCIQTLMDGLTIQIATGLAFLRDSLHFIIIGPLFGKEWVGHYSWALQLCGVSSQIIVQTATRLSLPTLISHKCTQTRWLSVVNQIKYLSIFTIPVLLCMPLLSKTLNNVLFQEKWAGALVLLPYILARMLPGIATTPLAAYLLAEKGAASYAKACAIWTAIELIGALIFTFMKGPTGLAMSYAIFAWMGIWLLLKSAGKTTDAAEITKALILRPSLLISFPLIYAAGALNIPNNTHTSTATNLIYSFLSSALVFIFAIFSENDVRHNIKLIFTKRFG